MSVTFNLVRTMERVKIWLMNTSVTVRMDLTAKAAQIVSKDMVSFNRTQNVLLHLKNEPYNHVQKRTVPWKNWTVPFTNRSLQYRNFTFLFKKKNNPKTYHADSVQWKFMQGGSQRRPKKRKWYFAKSVHFSYTAWLITTAQW